LAKSAGAKRNKHLGAVQLTVLNGGAPIAAAGTRKRVIVIGAGIVGMSSALFLQRDGHDVTLIDPRGPAGGASYGNAGIVEDRTCLPIATPGILAEIPGMLTNPYGPLTIRPHYALTVLPWLTRLLVATRWAKINRTADALISLSQHAVASHRDLAALARVEDVLQPVGRLSLYSTLEGFEGGAVSRAFQLNKGFRLDVLNPSEIHDLEPNLAPIFVKGVFHPTSLFVTSPKRLIDTCFRHFLERGGRVFQEAVTAIQGGAADQVAITDVAAHAADKIVVTAGAWSNRLCKTMGFSVPLESERGYHLTLPRLEGVMKRPTLWAEHYINLCPMEGGLRMTVGVEYAGIDAAPNYDRVRRLLQCARQMLPMIADDKGEGEWLGHRPSLPDSLPVLGPAPGNPNVLLAFGHNHIGLTLGPVTGRVVADLIAGRDPGLDLRKFSADRSYVR